MYKIKKGLDLPITGNAKGAVETHAAQQVAVLGGDYLGMKPTMMVQVGDDVKCGQKLFEDKKNPGVFFTSPVSGKVSSIHRGEKRRLLSVVIDQAGDDCIDFNSMTANDLAQASRDDVAHQLIESGLWTSLRTRPYSKIPAIDSQANSIFVTAIDTNPLAVNPEMMITEESEAFELGLIAVSRLTEGKTYLCKQAGAVINAGQAAVEIAE